MTAPRVTIRIASVGTLVGYADAGAYNKDWYADARRTLMPLARAGGVSFPTLAYVMAATSPRVVVSRNISLTFDYIGHGGPFRPVADGMDGLLPAARGALLALEGLHARVRRAGEVLNVTPPTPSPPWDRLGPKTGPFARALVAGGGDHVVLDSWMCRALVRGRRDGSVVWPDGPPTSADNDRAFGWMSSRGNRAECVRRIRAVARRLGWTPAQAQAAIWAGVMAEHGRLTGIAFPEVPGADAPDFDPFTATTTTTTPITR